MKTAKAAFDKWQRLRAPNAFLGRLQELEEAYTAGRRDLLKAQATKRQHAERKARSHAKPA
jgi:hypothetical protein